MSPTTSPIRPRDHDVLVYDLLIEMHAVNVEILDRLTNIRDLLARSQAPTNGAVEPNPRIHLLVVIATTLRDLAIPFTCGEVIDAAADDHALQQALDALDITDRTRSWDSFQADA